MLRKSGFVLFAILILASVFAFTFSSHAQSVGAGQRTRSRITEAVDEAKLTTLHGNTRSEANALNDRGLVPDDMPMEHMLLQLRRSPEQEQALQQFVDELYSPGSPNYHQWLTAQEFGQNFGGRKTLAPSPAGSADTGLRLTSSILAPRLWIFLARQAR